MLRIATLYLAAGVAIGSTVVAVGIACFVVNLWRCTAERKAGAIAGEERPRSMAQ